MSLLEIRELCIDVGAEQRTRVVDTVSLNVEAGRTTVLVGESGSGKSMTALAVVRLLPNAARITGGEIRFAGQNLLKWPEARMCDVRGARIGFVFQEPQTSLNPVMRIGDQVGEVLTRHRGMRGRARDARIVELLEAVEIADATRRMREYPHQFSGGMKQRVMVAIALAGEPDLLLADEPTTALDVSTQAQILELLRREQQRRGMGMLFITHDLAVAHQVGDELVVMRHGAVVEQGAKATIFARPTADYTRHLFAVSPRLAPDDAPTPLAVDAPALLNVRQLSVEFTRRTGLLRRAGGRITAVNDVDLDIRIGETLAVVGESGSGKTTLGRGVLRLVPVSGGRVEFAGDDLLLLAPSALRRARRELQVVFQDPYASMNPRMTVREIIEEGMIAQGIGLDAADRRTRVTQLLQQVGLDAGAMSRHPHEFSGGQRQRISIARALAVEPRLIVCDEPTSALDVSVQAQILALLRGLQSRLGLSYLFITHNLGVVSQLAHRVAVMHRGRIVETGPTGKVLFAPEHPYTKHLLAAVPRLP